MPESRVTPPPVMWAQRKNAVFLTILLEDCKNPQIKIQSQNIYFKGTGGTEMNDHEILIDLYNEIIPEESRYQVRDRLIELFLKKKEEGPFWPHLLKTSAKQHWLKVDFDKWKDEDDDDEYGNPDFDMLKQVADLGNEPDMGDLGDMDDANDSDDELSDDKIPDLE